MLYSANMFNERQLISLSFMARRLRVSPKWLREEAAAGRVPGIPAGDTWLFNRPVVEQLLLERATKGTPPKGGTP